MSYKGYFTPKRPEKYKGDPNNIIFRSSWELKFMNYLDAHQDVLQWSSEEFFVPYVSPIDGRVHRYFPDFHVVQKNRNGIEEVVVVEIKPAKQTKPPQVQKKRTKRYLTEVITWGVNEAKWKAALQYCKAKNWRFVVLTEKELGLMLNG